MSEPTKSMNAQTSATSATMPAAGASSESANTALQPQSEADPASKPDAPLHDTTDNGLSTVRQVIELADHLSACADALHARIITDIRRREMHGATEQAAMRSLLEDEMLLRQRANGLYADAATYVVQDLGRSQHHLIALTADAAEKIRRIGVIGETSGLIGALLSLAGAVVTFQPEGIILALDKMRVHQTTLQALSPASSG